MATEASPTPTSSAHRIGGVQHRLSRSSLLRQEPGRNSPATRHTRFANEQISEPKTYDGDSSDDEPVPGPKFSASVKALLKGDVMETSPHQQQLQQTSAKRLSIAARDFSSARPERHVRVASPHDSSTGSPAPRVVRVGSARLPSSKPESPNSEEQSYMKDLITPAPRTRSVRITGSRSTTRSPLSNSPSHRSNEDALSGQKSAEAVSDERRSMLEDDYVPRLGASSVLRSRAGEETGMHSSLRVKRVGRLTGSFLNGPARRGVLRRQSEEVEENLQSDRHTPEREMRQSSPRYAREENEASSRPVRTTSSPKLSWIDSDPRILEKPATAVPRVVDMPFSRPSSPKSTRSRSTPGTSEGSAKSESGSDQPQYRVPPPALPSTQDQENDPPPTFKRAKPSGLSLLDKPEKYSVVYDDDNKERELPPTTVSPRKPLTSRSNNTPRTMAPPPPKMSVLETATATGGAATTTSQSRKKRSQVTINHKAFTRMDCIGRGGTSRVYRVMAENYKIFALKRVNLEDADRVTLAGYKGEIDLLKRLENVDRVVRLFDWEINMEKHTLSVLMEIGESDLEKILAYRLNADDAIFDSSFTRFYWKEMLECVQAVHKHNIVHSDLKPANFLLVQGRLKIIDFGIANAISDDTVNVHREHQVGTPNYMSPEALIDSNAASGLPASVGKMMKLGKPSDVWSLGCILYKMVYGQPPFARIAKYYERIMAIPNPKIPIEFPQFAVGGVTVPPGLLRTMKRCLQRDQTLRPTTEELLSDRDPFLYPEAQLEGTVPVTQEMIARILTNVVNHCRVRGVPKEEELAAWPAGFFTKIKAAVEEEHK
uniref:Serine/threonine-protein kinase mph1 n=1 Tax=Talaromyces marneffei PM1 TaxID=1077442 RepID=A0A093VTH5_TALMA